MTPEIAQSNNGQTDAHNESPNKRCKLEEGIVLRVKKLSENGRAPERCSPHAAGYDLFSAVETTIPARGKQLVATDISIAVPEGHYGRVAPRSGLAHKHFIDVGAGVIDADYRGPLGVILFNFGETDFKIQKGDRIAQIIMERISTPPILVVEVHCSLAHSLLLNQL